MFFLFILIINIGDAIFELSGANKITPVDSHAARVHFVRTTNLRTIIRFRNNVCHLKRCYLTRQFSPLASCNAHLGEKDYFRFLVTRYGVTLFTGNVAVDVRFQDFSCLQDVNLIGGDL